MSEGDFQHIMAVFGIEKDDEGYIPAEVLKILWRSNQETPIGEVREKIRELLRDAKSVKPHPMQDIVKDPKGVYRFRENKIVTYLMDKSGLDLNHLQGQPFTKEDRNQFAQLIGYSVSGFGSLSYAIPEVVTEADRLVNEMVIGVRK